MELMPDQPDPGTGDNLGRIDDDVRAAFRYGAISTVIAVVLLLIVAYWLRSCGPLTGSSTAACGKPERIVLSILPSVMLFGAGIGAFVQTIKLWKVRRTWWGWQGVGWYLLTLLVLVFTTFLPALAGPGLEVR